MFLVIGTQRSIGRVIFDEDNKWTYCDILEYAALALIPFPKSNFADILGSGDQ